MSIHIMRNLNKDLLESTLKAKDVLKDKRILEAFRYVDRVDFVPSEMKEYAYFDKPISIGFWQTISQPFTVGFMLKLLEIDLWNSVLDIWAGSWWTTALLAYITGENWLVTWVEIIPELVDFGNSNLSKYNFKNAKIIQAGKKLWIPGETFDKILVSASAKTLPTDLILQLKPGWIIVIPIKESVWKIQKNLDGSISKSEFPGFIFVPLINW